MKNIYIFYNLNNNLRHTKINLISSIDAISNNVVNHKNYSNRLLLYTSLNWLDNTKIRYI
jgi:hypothetical protein